MCACVDSGSLDKSPIVQQRHHIVIPYHIGGQYLSSAWVNIARTHRIGNVGNSIFHTIIAHVIGVEVGIILRIVQSLYHILETRSLKSFVPILNTLSNSGAPFFGESRVHIVNYLLFGFNKFTVIIFFPFPILGFQPPPINIGLCLYVVFVRRINVFFCIEKTYALVF